MTQALFTFGCYEINHFLIFKSTNFKSSNSLSSVRCANSVTSALLKRYKRCWAEKLAEPLLGCEITNDLFCHLQAPISLRRQLLWQPCLLSQPQLGEKISEAFLGCFSNYYFKGDLLIICANKVWKILSKYWCIKIVMILQKIFHSIVLTNARLESNTLQRMTKSNSKHKAKK